MKFSQKAKYFLLGIFSVAVLIPLSIRAYDAITLKFNTGDVISATVFNDLLTNINNAQRGFSSVSDLDGTWSCTVYKTGTPFGVNTCSADGSLLNSKVGNLTFSAANKTWSWAGAGSLNDCGSGLPSTGTYDVKAGILVTNLGVYDARLRSPNEFIWWLTNSFPPSGFNVCTKVTAPPLPVNNLVASVSNSTITLTWSSPSSTQTGIKIQRTASALNPWVTIATASASATSYTDNVSLTGNYIYRAISTNSYGDSISSSEVTVAVTNIVSNSGASGSGSGAF